MHIHKPVSVCVSLCVHAQIIFCAWGGGGGMNKFVNHVFYHMPFFFLFNLFKYLCMA